MRDPAINRDSFRRSLKTFYFQLTRVHSTLELSAQCALQIYLLTYFSGPRGGVAAKATLKIDDDDDTNCC